ncbi:hypothetical protein [Jeotgalibacillus sp. R-1-5s-1]|uniref:hypothetical protein n=1 Tax=Jeotgalibacillus sp. R-1-5s-1 TaxID=2555897 RepID=UPI0010698FD8|nr:hypothetical protein [Jeotgalibacillus sp. R-1-5s-1]TFE03350.1 hypothetical protein E2491_00750 [Jeotgalibacillus sp. R-1-5s-1]
MGLKRYALLGLGAAGYAYFKKKENREKAKLAFDDSKVKVSQAIDQAKQSYYDYKNKDQETHQHEDEKMMSEGAQTSVQYYNEQQEQLDEIEKGSTENKTQL